MQSINSLSLTPAVNDWLANTRRPRFLYIFDHACNLINEGGEVLSIVTPHIGSGPFNLVVEDNILFSEHLNLESPISNSMQQLNLGHLIINTRNAKLWSPRPDWERLHAHRETIAKQLTQLQIADYLTSDGFDVSRENQAGLPFGTPFPGVITSLNNRNLSITQSLISSLCTLDLPSSLIAAQRLAGLGIGLTPAGDDFLMGAIYAARIIHPPEIAGVLAQEVANTAAPLTTSLSAAWLRCAGRGEAGVWWHEFFETLIAVDPVRIQESVEKILIVGETSGADALAGFLRVLMFDRAIQPSAS